MASQASPLRKLWYKWQSLRLPWRKQHLVGMDLTGNTFWEFRDSLNSRRFRRIVKYRHTPHLADVKISPQWHQWLRHTRPAAPSLEEQESDVQRLAQIRHLARLADERWASKPSFLDAPQREQPGPGTVPGDTGGDEIGGKGEANPDGGEWKGRGTETKEEDPWGRARSSGPGERWQPESWNPNAKR